MVSLNPGIVISFYFRLLLAKCSYKYFSVNFYVNTVCNKTDDLRETVPGNVHLLPVHGYVDGSKSKLKIPSTGCRLSQG